jgi:predicted permease
VASGEARRRAGIEFGSLGARKEECREALGLRLLDEVTGDLRYAFRQLRRAPAFTAVAVLSLALGIGANAATFSLMEAALWKSIPVRNPEDLRLFSWVSGPNRIMNGISGNSSGTPNGGYTSTSFSYPVFLELQRQNQVFEHVFAFKATGRMTAIIDGRPELLSGELVTGNFYAGVGVTPIVGRPIAVADDRQDAAEAAGVISDGYWARRFGRDPSVIGKRISVNSAPVTIVGVNPPAFTGVEPGSNPEIFLPMHLQPVVRPQRGENTSLLENPDVWWLLVLGRLKPGVDESQAEAALEGVFQQAVRATLPDRADRDRPSLEMLGGARGVDELSGDFSRPLLVLLSLVGVVLLIACANVANLLLARAAIRQREISLRLALGAGRWRIARQLLTEGFALAALGGIAGVVLGYWLRDVVPGLLSSSWRPSLLQAEFNWRVVGISAAMTMATGVVFSLAPAWRSARIEINAALKDTGRLAFRLPRWWRGKPLVAFQVCLSVLLLIGAGLFVRTLANLMSVSMGFRPDRILLFAVDPPRTRYPGERRTALFDQLQRRISEVPGVESATLSSNLLLGGGGSRTLVDPSGNDPESRRLAWVNDVGFDYFETMGIPIVYGREFSPVDHVTASRGGQPAVRAGVLPEREPSRQDVSKWTPHASDCRCLRGYEIRPAAHAVSTDLLSRVPAGAAREPWCDDIRSAYRSE